MARRHRARTLEGSRLRYRERRRGDTDPREGLKGEHLINMADECLYKAKKNRRNRVHNLVS